MAFETEYKTEDVAATSVPSDNIDTTFRSSCIGKYPFAFVSCVQRQDNALMFLRHLSPHVINPWMESMERSYLSVLGTAMYLCIYIYIWIHKQAYFKWGELSYQVHYPILIRNSSKMIM